MCKLRKAHDLKITPSTKFRLFPAAVCERRDTQENLLGLFCDTRGHLRAVQEISQDREQVGMIYESRNHRLVGSAGDGMKTQKRSVLSLGLGLTINTEWRTQI